MAAAFRRIHRLFIICSHPPTSIFPIPLTTRCLLSCFNFASHLPSLWCLFHSSPASIHPLLYPSPSPHSRFLCFSVSPFSLARSFSPALSFWERNRDIGAELNTHRERESVYVCDGPPLSRPLSLTISISVSFVLCFCLCLCHSLCLSGSDSLCVSLSR